MAKDTGVTIKAEYASNPLQFLRPALLEEVVGVLTKRFEAQVQIKSVDFLSEPERRNVVVRIILESPSNGVPASLILKQSLPQKSSEDDQEALGRFARDWAGLEFLSALNSNIAPKVYGGSQKYRFVLHEDLGESHLSLVDPLMGKDRKAAIAALNRFMVSMGRFHGCAYGNTENHKKLLQNLNPNADLWQDDFEDMISKMKPLLGKFNIPWTADLEREIVHIFKTCKEPGHFTTLMHGDICPDNVFDDPDTNTMHIIDFEWSFVGNALLDGTYLRMSNPTCWCVKAFPKDVIEPLETLYRQELMKKIPAASDDQLYYESYVSACAYWMLWRVVNLEDILETDIDVHDRKFPLHSKWKPEYNLRRPRNLARFQAFVEVSKRHDLLPHLRNMTEQILTELKTRWVDVKPLELYPAFLSEKEI